MRLPKLFYETVSSLRLLNTLFHDGRVMQVPETSEVAAPDVVPILHRPWRIASGFVRKGRRSAGRTFVGVSKQAHPRSTTWTCTHTVKSSRFTSWTGVSNWMQVFVLALREHAHTSS
eukprot:4807496-Amphidinium_carterae.1